MTVKFSITCLPEDIEVFKKNKKVNKHIRKGFIFKKMPCYILTKPEGTEVSLLCDNWTLDQVRNFRNKLYK